MRRKVISWLFWVIVLCGLLGTVAFLSFSVGSVGMSLEEIFRAVFKDKATTQHTILFGIRLPRIILALAVGGALSLAGVILQGIFRNPLVEPYTLGISGGAAVGVCLNIVLRLNQSLGVITLPLFGFLGAILVVILVYSLSIRKGILKISDLLLAGVMISFISSSLVMLIMSVCRTEDLHGIIFWIMGSLEGPEELLTRLVLGMSILGLVISYLFCFDLNAFSLGEEEAVHLGVNVERTKRSLFILASLLTAFSVSVAGIIGFVGLVVPHFVRMFIGRDHRILLIGSFLCGGSFLILCDTLARTLISPVELPVGVITGVFGGSLFIYALTKKKTILLGKR